LETLLTQIERSLPLNQLYIDLNSDERVKNDQAQTSQEIEAAIRSMLSKMSSVERKQSFLDEIKEVPPFCNHLEEIRKIEGEINER